MRGRALYPLPLFLAVGLLSMLPAVGDPTQVLLWRGGAFSDLLISHWPNAEFLRQSLSTWKQLPLWNPMILSGAPFAADPLAGLWYLPNWLAVLIPGALGWNLLIWLHLASAGTGTWLLARKLGLSHSAAIVAGIGFSASPKLLGHVGLGHVSLLYAVSWTPWALLAAAAVAEALGAPVHRRLATAALAGAVTGLVFLADPRWYPSLMLITTGFFVWQVAHSQKGRASWAASGTEAAGASGESEVEDRTALKRALWARAGALLLVGAVASLAVAAALALPLAEFVGLSTRAGLDLSQSAALSLPADRLSGLLAPTLGAWPEWQPYAGVVVLYLGVIAALTRAPGWRFWGAVALLGLVVALGDATPAYGVLRGLVPGFSQLRVPPRSLLLVGFSLAMLAAAGMDRLAAAPRAGVRLLAGSLFAVYLVVALVRWTSSAGSLPQERVIQVLPWVIAGGFLALAGLWTATGVSKRLSPGPYSTFLIALVLMDLTLVNLTTLKAQPVVADALTQRVAESIGSGQRVFSPSYSVTQPTAAELRLETADGVNPLQLASYRRFMDSAIGITDRGYSVTLPPFPTGVVDRQWGFAPNLSQLGLLAVSRVVSAYPVEDQGLTLLQSAEGGYIYENPAARPRAWVQGPDGDRSISGIDWSPNQIRVEAEGPGRLVLSEVDYPGWVAEVDGAEVPIQPYDGLLRTVQLATGGHEVVFSFRPPTVYAGVLLSVLGVLCLGSLWLRR